MNWFLTLNIIIRHITFNFVKNLGNEEKVFYCSIIAEGGGEHLVVKFSVPQDVDHWEEVLRPS